MSQPTEPIVQKKILKVLKTLEPKTDASGKTLPSEPIVQKKILKVLKKFEPKTDASGKTLPSEPIVLKKVLKKFEPKTDGLVESLPKLPPEGVPVDKSLSYTPKSVELPDGSTWKAGTAGNHSLPPQLPDLQPNKTNPSKPKAAEIRRPFVPIVPKTGATETSGTIGTNGMPEQDVTGSPSKMPPKKPLGQSIESVKQPLTEQSKEPLEGKSREKATLESKSATMTSPKPAHSVLKAPTGDLETIGISYPEFVVPPKIKVNHSDTSKAMIENQISKPESDTRKFIEKIVKVESNKSLPEIQGDELLKQTQTKPVISKLLSKKPPSDEAKEVIVRIKKAEVYPESISESKFDSRASEDTDLHEQAELLRHEKAERATRKEEKRVRRREAQLITKKRMVKLETKLRKADAHIDFTMKGLEATMTGLVEHIEKQRARKVDKAAKTSSLKEKIEEAKKHIPLSLDPVVMKPHAENLSEVMQMERQRMAAHLDAESLTTAYLQMREAEKTKSADKTSKMHKRKLEPIRDPFDHPREIVCPVAKHLEGHKMSSELEPGSFLAFDDYGRCLGEISAPIVLKHQAGKVLDDTSQLDTGQRHRGNADSNKMSRIGDGDTQSLISRNKSEIKSSPGVLRKSDHSVRQEYRDPKLECLELMEEIINVSEDEDVSLEKLKSLTRLQKPAFEQQSFSDASVSSILSSTSESSMSSYRPEARVVRKKPSSRAIIARGLGKELEFSEQFGLPEWNNDEEFDEYPSTAFLRVATPGSGRKTHGDSLWNEVERNVKLLQRQAALFGQDKIFPIYVDDFEKEKPKQPTSISAGFVDVKKSSVKGRTGKSALGVEPMENLVDVVDMKNRRMYGSGGLRIPRRSPFMSVGEMASFYSKLEEPEQSSMIGVLLSCRKLEKILEDQHTVIDMLEHDLEQARKTTFPPLENFLTAEQFTNLLDLDGNVPPDYFALPPVTSKFYSALFTDPATEAAKRAALSTEQRLREFLVNDPFRRKVNAPVLGLGGKTDTESKSDETKSKSKVLTTESTGKKHEETKGSGTKVKPTGPPEKNVTKSDTLPIKTIGKSPLPIKAVPPGTTKSPGAGSKVPLPVGTPGVRTEAEKAKSPLVETKLGDGASKKNLKLDKGEELDKSVQNNKGNQPNKALVMKKGVEPTKGADQVKKGEVLVKGGGLKKEDLAVKKGGEPTKGEALKKGDDDVKKGDAVKKGGEPTKGEALKKGDDDVKKGDALKKGEALKKGDDDVKKGDALKKGEALKKGDDDVKKGDALKGGEPTKGEAFKKGIDDVKKGDAVKKGGESPKGEALKKGDDDVKKSDVVKKGGEATKGDDQVKKGDAVKKGGEATKGDAFKKGVDDVKKGGEATKGEALKKGGGEPKAGDALKKGDDPKKEDEVNKGASLKKGDQANKIEVLSDANSSKKADAENDSSLPGPGKNDTLKKNKETVQSKAGELIVGKSEMKKPLVKPPPKKKT